MMDRQAERFSADPVFKPRCHHIPAVRPCVALLSAAGPFGALLSPVEHGLMAAVLLSGGNIDGHSFVCSVNIY